jgi:hypothetical protein
MFRSAYLLTNIAVTKNNIFLMFVLNFKFLKITLYCATPVLNVLLQNIKSLHTHVLHCRYTEFQDV